MGGNGLWRWAGASAPHSLFVSSFNPAVASLLPILVILGTTLGARERCPHVSLEHLESCPPSLSVWYFYLELHNWEVMLSTGQSGSELPWKASCGFWRQLRAVSHRVPR